MRIGRDVVLPHLEHSSTDSIGSLYDSLLGMTLASGMELCLAVTRGRNPPWAVCLSK